MEIAFASSPLLGHLNPLIPYMEVLVQRGHSVTCFHDSNPRNRKKLESCGLLPQPPEIKTDGAKGARTGTGTQVEEEENEDEDEVITNNSNQKKKNNYLISIPYSSIGEHDKEEIKKGIEGNGPIYDRMMEYYQYHNKVHHNEKDESGDEIIEEDNGSTKSIDSTTYDSSKGNTCSTTRTRTTVPSVVVYDFFVPGAADAADQFGCPAICIFPNASVTINPSLIVLSEKSTTLDMIRHQAGAVIMDLFEAVGARYLLYRRNLVRRTRNLSPMREQDVFPCRTMQRLTIGSCGFGFELANKVARLGGSGMPLFRMVGPSLPTGMKTTQEKEPLFNRDLTDWIEEQTTTTTTTTTKDNNNNKRPRHIVYVAFGTMYSHTKESVQLLQRQLEGLTTSQITTTTGDDEIENNNNNTNVSILWSLPESQQVFLRYPLHNHWMVESFVPQLSLLASGNISVFVSHCGSNSVSESLLNQVPIVACPGYADQPGNAVRIETAGVGRIARGGIMGVETAIRDVLFGKGDGDGDGDDGGEGSSLLLSSSSSSVKTRSSYQERCERLCHILATHGGANQAATIIEEAGTYGYDYLIPTVQRTNWTRRVAWYTTIVLLKIGTTILMNNNSNSNNKTNNNHIIPQRR